MASLSDSLALTKTYERRENNQSSNETQHTHLLTPLIDNN